MDLYSTTSMTTAQVAEHLGYLTRQCLGRWLAKDSRYAGHMAKSRDNADKAKAKAVREAVADLIDREAISKNVYHGLYEPMYSYVPSSIAESNDSLKKAYGDGKGGPDLEKAKKALKNAGVTTPVDLPIEYTTDYGAASADEFALIKQQLEEGGLFKVDLQQTEKTILVKDRIVSDDSDGSYPAYQLG